MSNPYKDAFSKAATTYGHLPHWNQNYKYQFITFRLGDSIPVNVINKYLLDKRDWLASHPKPWDANTATEFEELFDQRIEKYVDLGYGACLLSNPNIAELVAEKLHSGDQTEYQLITYVIMPNHVHVLVRTFEIPMFNILKKWKGGSAFEINRRLDRKGSLWQKEGFDTMIRDGKHYQNVMNYIYKNYCEGGVLYYAVNKDS